MKTSAFAIALIMGSAMSAPASAAEDRRFQTPAGGIVRSDGVAVQATLRIPLGASPNSRASRKHAEFDIVAGPDFRLADSSGQTVPRRATSPLLKFNLVPNRSASFSIVGQEIASRYTQLGLAERSSTLSADQPRAGISTAGWIAIGTGVVVVSTLTFLTIAANSQNCTELDCS
jgi:hypothetical protein